MDTYALPSVSYYANLADGTCGTDVEGAFMAGKKHNVNEPQGDKPDTYLHDGHQRPILPSANESSSVHETEPPAVYEIDPHDIPRLQWYQKDEDHVEVPTFTIHQHEAVNPLRILRATLADTRNDPVQLDLFGLPEADRRRLRLEDVYAYNHTMQWTNRMIAGDSLLVMNALLRHERLAGQVQCIYMDPPYGIKFSSNFMPSIHKRDVKDGKDEDLTAEPEMVTAFRDTWKWGTHSYLSYLRDRLILMHELLAPSGSLFVQISMENVHRVRCLLDEVFGPDNCVSMITYATTSGNESGTLDRAGDYLLWYAKDREKVKYHELFKEKVFGGEGASSYKSVELSDGTRMSESEWERRHGRELADLKKEGCRAYTLDNLTSQGAASSPQPFEFRGKIYFPGAGKHWKPNYPEGIQRLAEAGRLDVSEKGRLGYIRYFDDFPFYAYTNNWDDTGSSFMSDKVYVVQTSPKVIERCILMTTDPGDLVLDPTCGSGTTAVVAEEWGRRWITIDTSRVALALAKRRLITQVYDWYKLADEGRGVDGGLVYRTVPHVMLGDIANGVPSKEETLWDRPLVEKGKVRVTGPFTVEAHVRILNWQAMQWEDAAKIAKKRGVDKRGALSDRAYARAVLGAELVKAPRLLVINDEAHHAWRLPPKATASDYKGEGEEKDEHTVWVGGLDRIHRVVPIMRCHDFSATPFIPSGKMSKEDFLFKWIVSDFGLNDGIEAGLVKTPRMPSSSCALRRARRWCWR